MQQTMKQEKTLPKGTFGPRAALRAGGHCSTKTYIAPSKSACTAPTSATRRSDATARTCACAPG